MKPTIFNFSDKAGCPHALIITPASGTESQYLIEHHVGTPLQRAQVYGYNSRAEAALAALELANVIVNLAPNPAEVRMLLPLFVEAAAKLEALYLAYYEIANTISDDTAYDHDTSPTDVVPDTVRQIAVDGIDPQVAVTAMLQQLLDAQTESETRA